MKKTFKELQEIDSVVGSLYNKSPELKESKFGYAYKRFASKNYEPLLREYRQSIMDVQIDNALEDEKTKEILKDPSDRRGFKYSKEGLKKVTREEDRINTEFDLKDIEITPFICSNPPELNEFQAEMLEGCLITKTEEK